MRSVMTMTLLLLLATPFVVQAGELKKREAQELVEEYLVEDTSEARRGEIVERLQDGDPGLCASKLKHGAGDESTVGLAVELGLKLRVAGLFKSAAKFMDGANEDRIIDYGLALHEKGAAEAVWERWKVKEFNGTSWSIANAVLLKFSIPLDVIEDVKRFLDSVEENDDRREPSATILRFQLGLGTASVEKIQKDWKEIVGEYELNAKSFRLSGLDLLATGNAIGGVQVGDNRRLESGGTLTIPAGDDWQKGSYSIIVRVRVIDDGEVSVGIASAQGVWEPTFSKGEWILRTGREEKLVVDGELGEWTEIRFDLTPGESDRPGVEVRGVRTCKVSVGGKVMMAEGWLNGDMKSLNVKCTDGSSCTVGGVEFVTR